MTDLHLTVKTKRGRESRYYIHQRDPKQPRPWRAVSLTTGQELGSFKTLENAERSLRSFIADMGDTITAEKRA